MCGVPLALAATEPSSCRHRFVTTVVSQAGGATTVSSPAAINLSKAICNTSSASDADPSSRYASPDNRPRSARKTSVLFAATRPACTTVTQERNCECDVPNCELLFRQLTRVACLLC